jgi:ElaB/YqjD/DUF883 family membrane-anchored ribosome-binding protein
MAEATPSTPKPKKAAAPKKPKTTATDGATSTGQSGTGQSGASQTAGTTQGTAGQTSGGSQSNTSEAKSRFNAALDEARAGAAALKAEAGDRAQAYRDQARSRGDDWLAEAKNYGDQAKIRAGELAVDGKSKLVEALATLARAVSDTAPTVDEKLGAKYGDYTRSASRSLHDYSTRLDAKSVEEIGEDAREMVRKSPGLAVGVAAVGGFLLARLFRGSSD